MWSLKCNSPETGTTHYLYCGSTLMVSRHPANHIFLPNDKSISREHATITVLHTRENLSNTRNIPEAILQDCSSKYGTYFNEGIKTQQKIKVQTPIQLKHGDIIKFGLLNNLWRVSYTKLVVTSSQIMDLSAISEALLNIGGHIVKDWSADCNHLVMTNILLTAKTVCALASCSPIVTPQYLVDLSQAVRKKTVLPAILDYLPPLKEMSISKDKASFTPNEKRKTLFLGKTFIFCSEKSLHKLKRIIYLSGGNAELLSEENLRILSQDNNILIKGLDKKESHMAAVIEKATELLKNANLNAIPESDIGLSIVYVSIEKYCNPAFSVNELLRVSERSSSSQKSQPLEIYATETQSLEDHFQKPSLSSLPPSRTVILESGRSTKSSPASSIQKSFPSLNPSTPPTPPSGHSLADTCMSLLSQKSINKLPAPKENVPIRKRERTNSSEGISPERKRLNAEIGIIDHGKPKELELSQVLSKMESNDLLSSTEPFNPPVCSTLRSSPHSCSPSRIPKQTSPKRMADDPTKSSLESSPYHSTGRTEIAQSVQFDLFTLPSLKMPDDTCEDNLFYDAELRVQKTGIKKELVGTSKEDQTIDETLQPTGKRKRVEESDDDYHLEKIHGGNNLNIVGTKKSKSDEFVLPVITQSKRRGRMSIQREDKVASGSASIISSTDETDFLLPCRTAPRRKVLKDDSGTKSDEESILRNALTIKRSLSSIENAQVDKTNDQTFVSLKRTEIKEENVEDPNIKQLDESLEKSLVVVLYKSLVNKSAVNRSTTHNISLNSASTQPNFKNFKKVTSLNSNFGLRIIGGSDLVVNVDVNTQRDEFISTQLNTSRDLPDCARSEQPHGPVDDEFNLPMAPAVRSRKR